MCISVLPSPLPVVQRLRWAATAVAVTAVVDLNSHTGRRQGSSLGAKHSKCTGSTHTRPLSTLRSMICIIALTCVDIKLLLPTFWERARVFPLSSTRVIIRIIHCTQQTSNTQHSTNQKPVTPEAARKAMQRDALPRPFLSRLQCQPAGSYDTHQTSVRQPGAADTQIDPCSVPVRCRICHPTERAPVSLRSTFAY